MPETTFTHGVAWSQIKEFSDSVVVKGDLKCSHLLVRGDLKVTGAILAELTLQVTGSVTAGRSIHAGRMIKAGGSLAGGGDISARNIYAGGKITSGGSVRAIDVLTAGEAITATRAVEASQTIHCGGVIKAGAWVLCTAFDIQCTEIRNRLLPLGRGYWANLPMLAKWKDMILDPKMPWLEIRRHGTPEEVRAIASTPFGHWSLEGQLRVFLGAEVCVAAPPEARTPPLPVRFGPLKPLPEPEPEVQFPPNSSNRLLSILLSPVKTPFPDYSADNTYKGIMTALEQHGLLSMDLRTAYKDLNVSLTNIYAFVTTLIVPEAAVKAQVLNEINAATNIRLISSNHITFINSSILADDLKVQYVGQMVSAEDNDACSVSAIGILDSILGALSVVPDMGPIFTLSQAAVGVLQSGWAGGVQDFNSVYSQLFGALSAQLSKLLTVNGLITESLLSDWGKLDQANQLVINGTLSWPSDDSQGVTAAANAYEIEVFKVLLPLHWSPMYTEFDTNGWNCSACGANVTWNGNGYAGPTYYWLTWGALWWSDCHDAENELARIGVSIGDLTQGTGRWGSSIWAWNRQNPDGCQQCPNCCSK